MKLKMASQIPEAFKPKEDFEYDFAKAKKSITLPLLSKHDPETTIIEEKYDGSRYGGVITDTVGIISRNGIDRAKNVPYLCKVLKEVFPAGSIVDGEVVHINEPRRVRWELARSVMGTKEFNASVKPAQYVIFDIQYLGGECLRDKTLSERRKILQNLLASKLPEGLVKLETTLATSTLCMPRQFPLSMGEELYVSILADKGEGIMIKSVNEKYAKSWTKLKKVFTIDAFITGIEKGKGKFQGLIGALKLGVMQGDTKIDIGKCSGMTDDERKELTQMALDGELLHKVVEVKANEVTKNYKLRHPNFVRARYDKDMSECLKSQLEEHLK